MFLLVSLNPKLFNLWAFFEYFKMILTDDYCWQKSSFHDDALMKVVAVVASSMKHPPPQLERKRIGQRIN
jgi:hypothetical protein